MSLPAFRLREAAHWTSKRAALLVLALGTVSIVLSLRSAPTVFASHASPATRVHIDYPENGSIFPPGISAPTLIWRDDSGADVWRIDVSFGGNAQGLQATVRARHMETGPIDPQCVAATNKPPHLTPQQAASWVWKPDPEFWAKIQKVSANSPATISITGLHNGVSLSLAGSVHFTTSHDPVGAPIFYRDVPLMPSVNKDGTVQPLPPEAVHLIKWRIRDIRQSDSHTLLTNVPTCLNCHSFSMNGKTMGIDLDGPNNDKGLYAITQVKQHIRIDDNQVVQWNTDGRAGKIRVGFMSRVSPDGRYVVSTFSGSNLSFSQTFYVRNFPNFRFLQVFYPTKGILEYYDRTTGRRQPLPGADDPRYVQTGGFWSPDGKWIIFSRALARDPYVKDKPLATFANDPNETKIQYDLYRVPFNDGKGGTPEPIVGASHDGMSNNFPKVSPDGKWIVFVKCKNGEVMRPDSELYIVPFKGGVARRLRSNLSPMNSWHSWSPNSRWLVFSSKGRSPYTQMFLTHIDAEGNASPAVLIENATDANRAVNLPEFLNVGDQSIDDIQVPAIEVYRHIEKAIEFEGAGEIVRAQQALEEAIKAAPDDARLHSDLAAVLDRRGQPERAAEEARIALDMSPTMAQAHFNLGVSLLQQSKFEDAIQEFEKTIDLYPGLASGEEGIAQSYDALRQDASALPHWKRAIALDPQSIPALLGAARILAASSHPNLRDGQEALRLAQRAGELTADKNPTVLDTLAAAYAETGDYAEALAVGKHALDLATEQGDQRLAQMIEERMALYRTNHPYRN